MKYKFLYIAIALFLLLTVTCMHSKDMHLIKTANTKYYNLAREGLSSFSCRIEVKELNDIMNKIRDNFSDVYSKRSVKNVQFVATLRDDGYIHIKRSDHFKFNNDKFNRGFQLAVNGAEKIIHGFFVTWGELTFKPVFPEEDHEYSISSDFDYYYIDYEDGKNRADAKLTKNLNLVKMLLKQPHSILTIKTDFLDTKKGFLLQNYQSWNDDDSYGNDTKITYQAIDGFRLPRYASISNKIKGNNEKVNLIFYDYQLEKK